MIVSELYKRLGELIAHGHGGEEVFLDTDPNCLHVIEEVDLDCDEVGVIIWAVGREEEAA